MTVNSPPINAPFAPAAVTPPASVPLGFLTLSGVGLTVLGVTVALGADLLVQAANAPGPVAIAHVSMLAFLTMAVLGAAHQFTPVVARRPLRSGRVAHLTLVGMAATATLLPIGFSRGPEMLVATGAIVGSITVLLALWNLSHPLAATGGGVSLAGLRLSLGFLAVTVALGVTYAISRQTGWFAPLPHRVLAHAEMGLLGWLGLTYVAVAEKLWPMFLLAHRPSARPGAWAVGLLGAGAPLITAGFLTGTPVLTWTGGVVATAGLVCHLVSLASAVRHRRRPLELLHAFLFTSAAFLVAAVVLAVIAVTTDPSPGGAVRLAAAHVTALVGWLGLAVVGHVHKIVPFITYTALRAKGTLTGPTGKPLMFGDLIHRPTGWVSLAGGVIGFGGLVVGLLAASPPVVIIGGVAMATVGAVTTINLALGPRRVHTPEVGT